MRLNNQPLARAYYAAIESAAHRQLDDQDALQARWGAALSETHGELSEKLNTLTGEILQSANNDQQKIAALLQLSDRSLNSLWNPEAALIAVAAADRVAPKDQQLVAKRMEILFAMGRYPEVLSLYDKATEGTTHSPHRVIVNFLAWASAFGLPEKSRLFAQRLVESYDELRPLAYQYLQWERQGLRVALASRLTSLQRTPGGEKPAAWHLHVLDVLNSLVSTPRPSQVANLRALLNQGPA